MTTTRYNTHTNNSGSVIIFICLPIIVYLLTTQLKGICNYFYRLPTKLAAYWFGHRRVRTLFDLLLSCSSLNCTHHITHANLSYNCSSSAITRREANTALFKCHCSTVVSNIYCCKKANWRLFSFSNLMFYVVILHAFLYTTISTIQQQLHNVLPR